MSPAPLVMPANPVVPEAAFSVAIGSPASLSSQTGLVGIFEAYTDL